MENVPERLLVDIREAAAMLGICAKSLWSRTMPRGTIPAVKIGSRILYSPSDLQAWIDSQKMSDSEACTITRNLGEP